MHMKPKSVIRPTSKGDNNKEFTDKKGGSERVIEEKESKHKRADVDSALRHTQSGKQPPSPQPKREREREREREKERGRRREQRRI